MELWQTHKRTFFLKEKLKLQPVADELYPPPRKITLLLLLDLGEVNIESEPFRCFSTNEYGARHILQRLSPTIKIRVANLFNPQQRLTLDWLMYLKGDIEADAFRTKVPVLAECYTTLARLKNLYQQLRFDAKLSSRLEKALASQSPSPKTPLDFQTLNQITDSFKFLQTWFKHHPLDVRLNILQNLHKGTADLEQRAEQQVQLLMEFPAFARFRNLIRTLNDTIEEFTRFNEQALIVNVEVINATAAQLAENFTRAQQITHSSLYRLMHGRLRYDARNTATALLSNHQFDLDSLDTLRNIAQACHLTNTVFIAQVAPALFGVNDLNELTEKFDFAKHFAQEQFAEWNHWRSQPSAKNVVLVVSTHYNQQQEIKGFEGADSLQLGRVLANRFTESHWFSSLQGRYTQESYFAGLFYNKAWGASTKLLRTHFTPSPLERKFHEWGFCALKDIPCSALSIVNHTPTMQRTAVKGTGLVLEQVLTNLEVVLNENHAAQQLQLIYQRLYNNSRRENRALSFQELETVLEDWLQGDNPWEYESMRLQESEQGFVLSVELYLYHIFNRRPVPTHFNVYLTPAAEPL